ncbi:GNAT family N-acetyltransferase [Rhodococcus sp. ARC_M6]|uniref:GNAT family N-acetyltransferase n=1 Tax=Rhodococcus sp. ARC_M6 TaxID=2928852 RepID=UPI001FB1CA75|nr:GNAT family protein [Rhodococcus sp. ARC_M6]MCJ0907259.1 GNAT family N-acetyltransferase [Rhodococcus sp. ARC_M6]
MTTAPELRGPRVLLTPVEPDHHSRLRAIHLHPDVVKWWQNPDADWPSAREPGAIRYSVFHGKQLIGFIQWYAEDDPDFRHAGLDLFLDPDFHGRGFGRETIRVLCAHLIDALKFHRLIIDPEVDNTTAIACYRSVGFKDVGVMREYSRDRTGVWKNGLLMDLLAREFIR